MVSNQSQSPLQVEGQQSFDKKMKNKFNSKRISRNLSAKLSSLTHKAGLNAIKDNMKQFDIDYILGDRYLRNEREHVIKVWNKIEEARENVETDIDGVFGLEEKIKIMEDNLEIAKRIRPTMMKSKTQTYDIRDADDFKGVFEVEVLLESEIKQQDIRNQIARKLGPIFKKNKKVGSKNERVIQGIITESSNTKNLVRQPAKK